MNKRGLELIKYFEKCRLMAYDLGDGKNTIGWGNTFYEDKTPVKMGDIITQEQADELFSKVISQFENSVKRLVKSDLNENQLAALISFEYNAGVGSLVKSDLLRAVNINPNDPKISAIFKNQNVRLGSKFEHGLSKRRLMETELYFTPV